MVFIGTFVYNFDFELRPKERNWEEKRKEIKRQEENRGKNQIILKVNFLSQVLSIIADKGTSNDIIAGNGRILNNKYFRIVITNNFFIQNILYSTLSPLGLLSV